MYNENVLTKYSITINVNDVLDTLNILNKQITFKEIYSYLVYSQYSDDRLNGWLIEWFVSDTEYYNTIDKKEMLSEVDGYIHKDYFAKDERKYVIGHKQPPLEIILTLYEPLINKLSKEQQRCWNNLELEDLCQICRMVIIKLYNKNYYLHKQLIRKSFSNEVLKYIQKDKFKPITVSLDYVLNHDESGNAMTVMDTVIDIDCLNAELDAEDYDEHVFILKQKRELIIEEIGHRQYEQLVKEYGSRQTTEWGRNTVNSLKRKLNNKGLYDIFKN